MIPESYKQLFDRLLNRTQAGEVNCKNTADESTFAIHLREFSLTMFRGFDRDDGEFVRWELINNLGNEIDSFYVSEKDKDWVRAVDLFDRARRKAIRLDDAIEAVMQELDSANRVGLDERAKPKPPASSPFDVDDDDLPF